jgi:hypothetical protein
VANVPLLIGLKANTAVIRARLPCHGEGSLLVLRSGSGKLKFEMRDGKPDTRGTVDANDGQYSATDGCSRYACGISRYPQVRTERREMLENQYNPYSNRRNLCTEYSQPPV